MTAPARYTFLPWVRRGLSSLASDVPAQNYLTLQVAIAVNGAAGTPVPVRLYGPAQVTGVEPRAIVRTEPRADSTSFEPNYLPSIEFATPEFPWLFSPAVSSGAVLRPWLCLVVVREQDGVALVPRPQMLPLLEFADPAIPRDELPDLDQIAAWAHAQFAGDAPASDDALRAALDDPASLCLSRLICPRRLEPATRYLACVVPTWHAGAQAGISPDLPVTENDVAPAWTADIAAPFALPVYFSWRFSTSADGDFASLARRMRPPTQPLELGLRDMDISSPGFGLPAFEGLVLGLEGALRSHETTPTPWPDQMQAKFESALRPILAPPATDVPVVAPPIYGQVPANASLPAPEGKPIWLGELNLDPRSRAAAGMGAAIVGSDQEALMASAWNQYAALRQANQLLRQMQVARAVTQATLTRHFSTLETTGTLLQMTGPLHARVKLDTTSPLTLGAQVAASSIPATVVLAGFRRLARRRGPVGRLLFAPGVGTQIVERLNAAPGAAGAMQMVTARVPPQGVVLIGAVSPMTTVADLTPTAVLRAGGWMAGKVVVAPPPAVGFAEVAAQPSPVATSHLPKGGGGAGGEAGGGAGGGGAGGVIGPVHGFPIRPDLPDIIAAKAMTMRFRAAATAVTTYVGTRTTKILDAPPNPSLAATLATVQTLALDAVNPMLTIVARARARLPLPTTGDPLRPLLGEPIFVHPMSRELTPQQLLPGVGRVPQETAALLVTNSTFVEAFMVGLNDAMRREFAWRQYPVDQRATFFTRFWSAGAGAASPDDIPPVAGWDGGAHLGDNATTHGEQVVLLLRGQLLRRYPNAIVSVVEAVAGPTPDSPRTLGTTELFPIFRGAIDPDMVFFGFALSETAAVAGAGWYFVLAEHPTEPRFGLESMAPSGGGALTTWNDLGWPQVAIAHNHIDLSATAPSGPLEGAAWNSDAAQQATIAFRRPVRLALHATALLG